MSGQVVWRLKRSVRGTVTGFATPPGGNALKRRWPDLQTFIADVDGWVEEVAKSVPIARVIPQDWPASRPTWPWPEELSAEREWLDFLCAWQDRFGEKPVLSADLVRLAKRQGLLRRFLADPGYTGLAEFRLSVVLRSFLTPWHGYGVAVEGGRKRRLYTASGEINYDEVLAAFRRPCTRDDDLWARADAALQVTENLGRKAASRLAADTGLTAGYIRQIVDTARTFPPEARVNGLSFSHHKVATMASDPLAAIRRSAGRKCPVSQIRESKTNANRMSVYLRPDEIANIDEHARRHGVTRSAYVRIRLLDGDGHTPAQALAIPHPAAQTPDPRALETLTADAPLSCFWETLAPWTDRLGGQGATWFRQWPLAPGVAERIESVWPLIAH